MKKPFLKCDSCPISDYSSELCRAHLKHLAKEKTRSTSQRATLLKACCGKAAIGAGIGVTGCVAGMAVVPALGMKALLGHLVAVKVAGAGGLVGAGGGVARQLLAGDKQRKRKAKMVRMKKATCHPGVVSHLFHSGG